MQEQSAPKKKAVETANKREKTAMKLSPHGRWLILSFRN